MCRWTDKVEWAHVWCDKSSFSISSKRRLFAQKCTPLTPTVRRAGALISRQYICSAAHIRCEILSSPTISTRAYDCGNASCMCSNYMVCWQRALVKRVVFVCDLLSCVRVHEKCNILFTSSFECKKSMDPAHLRTFAQKKVVKRK